MHDEQNFFDIDSYHEFIQRQPYVDDTHPNPSLIISKPSSNPLESQSQNAFSHFEIHNDEGDDQETIDTQDTRKKSNLLNDCFLPKSNQNQIGSVKKIQKKKFTFFHPINTSIISHFNLHNSLSIL